MSANGDLILAIDQGTTGTTCLLVDAELRVVARSTHDFPQHFPRPGWVEHDVEEIWASVIAALGDVLRQVDGDKVAGIGITNQRETSVVWSRSSGKPLQKAIVWQDRRTAERCQALRDAGHETQVRDRTGLVLDPYFSGTKLAWTLDHHDGARAAAERGELAAGTIDTYLVHRLTAGRSHVTEPSNASRTMLWPLRGGDWDAEMCELLQVPRALLPEVLDCNARFGTTQGVPGLRDGIPIHGIAGDQQAALFGQACLDAGLAKCTYGTGAFAMLNTGSEPTPSAHGLLTTVAWRVNGTTTYALEGSAFMAGATVQWLRDGLGLISSASEIEALARSVPDSGGVTLVPGHAGLGAPHWRAEARGLISGLTRGSTRAHIARAALEGIALSVDDLLQAMAADHGKPITGLRVDGGAAANDLLMELQADLLGTPIDRPQNLESTAMGAVFLAGLGVGMWQDTRSLAGAWQRERSFEPDPSRLDVAALREGWRQAVAKA